MKIKALVETILASVLGMLSPLVSYACQNPDLPCPLSEGYPRSFWDVLFVDVYEVNKLALILLCMFLLAVVLAAFFALRKKYTGKNHPYALYILLLTPTPFAFAIGKDLAGPWVVLLPVVFVAYIFWRAMFKSSLKSWHRILVILASFFYVILWGGLFMVM